LIENGLTFCHVKRAIGLTHQSRGTYISSPVSPWLARK
jgi:hypothetical protein